MPERKPTIRELRNVLAEAGRQLLVCGRGDVKALEAAENNALEIARFLGYDKPFNWDELESFLSSIYAPDRSKKKAKSAKA